MTPRKIDEEKYLRILDRLSRKETQSSIIKAEKCSYGTISAAKQWNTQGRPPSIADSSTRGMSEVGNISKIDISIPSFWLELIDDNIEAGLWYDRSDAILDLIRTYFRPQMDENKPDLRKRTPEQIRETAKKNRGIRRGVLGEIKDSFEEDDYLEKLSDEERKIRDEDKKKRHKELNNELEEIKKRLTRLEKK